MLRHAQSLPLLKCQMSGGSRENRICCYTKTGRVLIKRVVLINPTQGVLMKNWKYYVSVGVFAVGLGGNAAAQSDYYNDSRGGYDDRDALVTVYEHCDFRGASRVVEPGDYRSMASIRFGNDQMSSIRVSRGSEVTIYEDDDYRGAYARIDRDISCFDKSWNDKVSSMSVKSDRYSDNLRRGGDNRYDNNRRADDRVRNRDDRRYGADRPANQRDRNNNVTAKNVSQVVFGSSVLQQKSKKHWELRDPRGGVSQFKENSRDENSVYLQNNYTAEKVRIDLFANDVTFINRNGRQDRYVITRKQAALASTPAQRPRPAARPEVSNRAPSRRINSECFNFRAYTKGGQGGLRFHGKKDFYRFNKKVQTGRVCHNGSLTMEINKTNPNTEVFVEIEGNRYRFARNEAHDAYKNDWYRKKVRLKVGR